MIKMLHYFQAVKASIRNLLTSKEALIKQANQARNLPWQSLAPLLKMEYVHIGKYTYGLGIDSVMRPSSESPVSIGSYCSFAPGVCILAHANHPTTLASTYPFKTLFCNRRGQSFDTEWTNHDATNKGPIVIGHDVWVGQNAIILSGVTIGDGAVIGAGAVVTRSIPPYAIAVGNPAKIVKYRFTQDIVEQLQKLEWWHFSDSQIERLMPFFYGEINNFIEEARRIKE